MNLLSLIPGVNYARIATYVAVAASIFLAGAGTHKHFSDKKIAKLQSDWAANVLAAVEANAQAERDARAKETALRAARDDAQKELTDALAENQRLAQTLPSLPRVSPVDAGLRGALETARLASQAAGESASAASRRASIYEKILAEGDGVIAGLERSLGSCRDLAVESALAHDNRSAEVAALLKAWPK